MIKSAPLYTALALALAMAAAGCGKTNKINTPSTTTPPASGPVELKLKWTPGEHIVQEMDMKMDIQSFLPGMPEPMKQSINLGQKFSLSVVSANPDGGRQIELQFLSVRMDMESARGKMSYDSDQDSTNTDNPLALMGKMVGARLEYTLDASNKVEHIDGVDELLDRLSADNPAAAQFKSTFNEDYFKQVMDSSRYLPPKPVQPGDTWPIEFELPIGVFGAMHAKYTGEFKDWEMRGQRNCALLEFAGVMEIEPNENSRSGFNMALHSGKNSGEIWFDPELGMVIDSKANLDMTMIMTVPTRSPRGAAAGTQTITNQTTQTISFKVDSVN